jgi:hypothetical protein
MGERWTEARQRSLEQWQEDKAEALRGPKDFLVAHDINLNDRLRGFARYAVAVLKYWAVGVSKPLPFRMLVDLANIDRLRDPARQKEIEEWMKADPMKGDPFEGLIFDDD